MSHPASHRESARSGSRTALGCAEICAQQVEPDGLEFDVASLRVAPIRIENAYGGQRVKLVARLGSGRLRVQIDVGIGDAVLPEPEWIDYPSLLDLPRPRIPA